jgi:diguanylate cyclase (GGDEF)-like protein
MSELWIYTKITRPLNTLIKGIMTWDGIRLPDLGPLKNRNDEIGEVAKAFIEISGEVRSKTKSLEDQARRDGLTGLFNRRRFDEVLSREWSRHKRENSQLAIVLADIDHFKSYNDIYGHQNGDECLRLVARAFGRGVRRPGDIPFRYGGEEFALILAGTDLEGAATVAEMIRSSVAELELEHTGNANEGVITMSFGVAATTAGDTLNSELLVRDADDALYSAKKAGRNLVRTAG